MRAKPPAAYSKRRAVLSIVFLFCLLSLAAGAVFPACGGKVVIDEDGATGSGGGSSGSGPGFQCSWPIPPGGVVFCGSVGAGPGGECQTIYCDADQNQFEAFCSGSSCSCRYNTQEICVCVTDATDLCSDSIPYCCPAPLP